MLRTLRNGCCVTVLVGSACFAAGNDVRLVDAAKKPDLATVRALLAQHPNVNAPEVDGTTALHWAAHWNNLEMAEMLLRAGANPNAANRYGSTPLYLAAKNGSAPMLASLLKAGADPNATLPEGQTALMTAARTGSLAAVTELLGHDARVNAKENWHGETALMWAAAENRPAVVQALLEHGADVNARSEVAGFTPSAEGYLPAPFLPAGGFTPLLFAVRSGHLECVRILLAAGANVNDTLPNGAAALMLAVSNAHYELGALLLDKGADPNADGMGFTALHQLVWTRNPNRHFNLPPPIPTGKLDSLDLAKALISHGAKVNARMTKEPRDGWRNWMNRVDATPFLLAAKAADPALMHLLLEHGADPTLESKDHTTDLMAAAGIGYWQGESAGSEHDALEAVKLALELGAKVNSANDGGFTPLHGAAVRGANSIVQLLVDKGAQLDAKTKKEGWTALAIADGVFIANTYKAQPHTAELLRKLMGVSVAADARVSQ
jgi:ankyrin repeat protein